MIKYLVLLCSLFISVEIFAENPAGFLWYNLPKEEIAKKPKGTPFSQLSYTDKDAVLKFYTMEALHKVRFTHSIEDERVFLVLQDYWLKEASLHGKINQKTLLQYPEFDYSVTHPTSNIGMQLQKTLRNQEEKYLIERLAKTNGLLFFYRGSNPYDLRQIPILLDFCKKYHFSLSAISVDGARAEELPRSMMDRGQADVLRVRYFPAILLVNPKTKITTPVAYGLMTQDVLATRIMNVATNFKDGVE